MDDSKQQQQQQQQRIMNELKASLFAYINPKLNATISNKFKIHIEQRLHEFFPTFQTPSHPPYASMILRAISELNDKVGSTKEAISAFLKREYKTLPFGHESFLSRHLEKLCGNVEIKCVNGDRYVLVVRDCDFKEITGSNNKRKGGRRGKQRQNQVRVKKEKQIIPERKQDEVFRNPEKQRVKMAEIKPGSSGHLEKGEKKATNCTARDSSYSCILGTLKDLVFENLYVATNPSKSIPHEFKSRIEQQLKELFPNFRTPTHPPYDFMIQKAILELNQEGRLNEEAISSFIKREFKDLPFGHESFLRLRLKKLYKNRNLMHASRGQNLLPNESCDFSDAMGWGMKKNWHIGRHCINQGRGWLEKWSELAGEEILSQKQETGEQTKPKGVLTEVNEQPFEAEKQKTEVIEQKTEVIEVPDVDEEWGREMTVEERQPKRQKAEPVEIPNKIKEQNIVPEEQNGEQRQKIQMTMQQIVPWSQEPLCAMVLEEKVLELCCDGAGSEVNLRIASEGSSMPVVGDGKQLQIESPCKKRELVCAVLARQHHQPNISGRKAAAKSLPVQFSPPEFCKDTGQHFKISNKNMNMNTSTFVSPAAEPLLQFEQQKHNCKSQRRPPKSKRDKNMITKSGLASIGYGWNEQQQQLECQGYRTVPTLPLLLYSNSNDQDYNKQQQLQAQKQGRGRPRKRI